MDTSELIEQIDRIEFEIGKYDYDFNIVNGRRKGLLVVKETSVRNQNGYGWELTALDTSLVEKWNKLTVIPYNYNLRGWAFNEENYFLLFTKSSYTPQDLIVFEVMTETGDIKEYELSTVFPIQLSNFEVLGSTVILGGTTNFRPAVLTYNLEDEKPVVVPGVYNGNNELVDIQIDRDAEIFSVITMERLINKNFTIAIKSFTTENILVQNNVVNPNSRNNIIDGATTNFQGGYQYIAGTYSNRNTQYSRGLYLAKFVNGNQQFINYINYADLENFWDYMRDRREKRVRSRIERRRAKGKKLKFSYKILIHDMIQRGDHYVLIGEAYYVRYNQYQQYGMTTMGAIPQQYSGVSGYKYTHAIVVAFNQYGEMIWDHSFDIDDAFTYELQEFVTVNVHDEHIELLYLEKNLIRSKLITGDEVVEGKSYTPIKLPSDRDEIKDKDPEIEGLEKWFDHTHFAYGEQTIERKTPGKSRRDVFYINKVRYNIKPASKN